MKHPLIILISILLIMSGCTPYVISSNPRQVTIGNMSSDMISIRSNAAESQAMADKECQKYERYAIHRPDTLRDGEATYECVE